MVEKNELQTKNNNRQHKHTHMQIYNDTNMFRSRFDFILLILL